MKKHKYLREIYSDELPFPFCEKGYPDFDYRDTFNLDMTIVARLYESLRFFQERTAVNLEYEGQTWNIDDIQHTLGQCIKRMVADCRKILECDFYRQREDMDSAKDDLFKVLSKCFFALWH